MQAYHEELSADLSEKKIRIFNNTVKSPRLMVTNHWHDAYEILYVRHGFGEQQINAQKFKFVPGTVIVIRPGDVHSTTALSENGCEMDVLQFVSEYFAPKDYMLVDLISSVTDTASKEMFDLFDTIKEHGKCEKTSDALILSGAVFMLCGMLLKNCQNSTNVVKMTAFAHDVCQYLHTHDNVKLDAVAQYFAYSPEHFSRKFHADLGISYKHYCEKIKVQRILKVLENDSFSLAEIAEQLEYSDTSSFIRAFKRIYGMTPGAYKRLKNKFD